MARSGKVVEKVCEKSVDKMRICWVVVKKVIQKLDARILLVGFLNYLWEKSVMIYTKKLFNYICCGWSFAGFAQTTTIITKLNNEYINKGGV